MDKEKLATGLKWGLGIGAAVAVAPFVYLLVKGVVGIALAVVVGLAAVNFMPLLARYMATVSLEGFKGLARKNPVETRQIIAMRRREELSKVGDALREFGAEVRNVEGHVQSLRQAGDADGAKETEEIAIKLRKVLDLRTQALQAAHRGLEEYEKVTEKVGRRWKAAQAAIKAQKLAGASASKELDRIMSEEALESVENSMNRVFADLDHAMAMELPTLENNPSASLTVTDVRVKELAQ